MRNTPIIQPDYAEKFRCIGPDCEDSCCVGWKVYIDPASYEKYQTIPAGPLRTLIDASILRTSAPDDGSQAESFAQVRLTPTRQCPFHNADRLCQIQVEHGESFLSRTCATYPRIAHAFDGLKEETLTLSCPEAARLVLLTPRLLSPAKPDGYQCTWNDQVDLPSLRAYFWPVRELVLSLAGNRAYPLWQRLFLLGAFCRRLDSFAHAEVLRGFAAFLRDFSAAVRTGALRASMETISADLSLQLDIVQQLVKLRTQAAYRNPRLLETLHAFTEGIGAVPGQTAESQAVLYGQAYERFYEPFFRAQPHILENYLVNTILLRLFPYGDKPLNAAAALDPTREFAVLAIQFALIKGLLIGVAGYYREAFSVAHVVQTVQTASRHFDHCPEFFDQASALLAARNLNNTRGLTMLVRN